MSDFDENEENIEGFDVDIPEEDSDVNSLIDFDITFQQSILKLGLEDDHFCGQLVKYLAQDKDLKNVDFLETEELNILFQMIADSFKKYQRRPSEGQLRQKIVEFKDKDKTKGLNAALNLILKCDVSDEDYYRQHIGGYVKQVKFIRAYKKMKPTFLKHGPEKGMQVFQAMLDGFNAVSFEKDTIFKLGDFEKLYENNKNFGVGRIPTGITKLDKDTLGGLPRQGLTVILSGTNVGKSMFCIGLGCQALKAKDEAGVNQGFKVFHVNLEGNAQSIIFRYYSNLAQIPYEKIVKGELSEDELARMRRIKNDFDERFLIKNYAGAFGNTIEAFAAYCKEIYKTFKFDLVIVDYGQLLSSNKDIKEYRLIMAEVFRGLDTISKAFNCAVVSPAQATRDAQAKQNPLAFGRSFAPPKDQKAPVMRSNDISEAFEIARVADVIMSLNATDEEKAQSRMRVFLEKQRDGAKNQTYGLNTRFDLCDLITGSFYEPNATVSKEAEAPEIVNFDEKNEVVDNTPEGRLDKLIKDYQTAKEKENNARGDYNAEKNKPLETRDDEILNDYKNLILKFGDQCKEIASKAQEVMKEYDPDANEEKLRTLEQSLRDLERNSSATDEQIQAHIKIVDRYRLGLRGKI